MKALFYTRHNLTPWVRFISENLSATDETLIISELRNEGVYSLANNFYEYIDQPEISKYAVEYYGEGDCVKIIARCRLLRNIDKNESLKMIGAMTKSLQDVLNDFNPDVFIALRIDSYVLDIMDRLLKERQIPYLGLWKAALVEDMFFVTIRGEHFQMRDPNSEEINELISNLTKQDFKATSISGKYKYDLSSFLKKKIYYFLRDTILNFQRFIHKDYYGYRYLTTGKNVKEYNLKATNWLVNDLIDSSWEEKFNQTAEEKRIFIGLQVNPESTIDYYVENLDLINYQDVLVRMIGSLSKKGFKVFIKDHPNMFAMRQLDFIKEITKSGSVCLVPYDVPSTHLIYHSKATFTWTGTIGLQAAMLGKCAVVVDPPYYLEDHFIKIASLDDIEDLPQQISNYERHADINERRRRLADYVLSTYLPGKMELLDFNPESEKISRESEQFLDSLNRIIIGIQEEQMK